MTSAQTLPTETNLDILKSKINAAYHLDENISVKEHLTIINISDAGKTRIKNTARTLVEDIRANRKNFGGLDKFLQEFGLTTDEGIALMCLAEALLRVPDGATADKLIRDKIGTADWDKHLGHTDDLFLNASTWALMLTGKVIGGIETENQGVSISSIAQKIVSTLGEPVVRQAMLHAMKIMGKQFVMGRSITEAIKRAKGDETSGYLHSYDMLGEGARTMEDADIYFKSYQDAIDSIGAAAGDRKHLEAPGISIKLSALHPRYEYTQRNKCVPELTTKLLSLAQQCARLNIGLTVDAEEANRLGISLDIFENVFTNPSLKDWEGFGLAIQSYQKRCIYIIDWLAALSESVGRKIMVRLVKGAYWDTEIKYAQVEGLSDYPVFTRRYATDTAFVACAQKLLDRRDVFYPKFGTHNAHTVASIIEIAGEDKTGFEFQRLHGMAEPLYHNLVGPASEGKYPCRMYTPVGVHQDLLPYLVRRLLENGANTNFINRLQNDKLPIEEILEDPMNYMAALDSKPHPKIGLPDDMFPDRKNSAGIEFADDVATQNLLADVEEFAKKQYTAAPLINGAVKVGTTEPVLDPTDNRREVGRVTLATKEDIAQALDTAHGAFKSWDKTPAMERAACLDRAADIMEENMAELLALCVREAGKILPDAVAEVREAVDFCRFYAAEGRKHFANPIKLPGPTGESNTLSLSGRGVFLCISPWNFPMAIFTGQVAAALVAGNTVIAKPAGQTNLIAMRTVEILFEAGIPKDALTILPVSGRLAGEHLVPDTRIAGVCFTGSTGVAQTINKTLAARDGPIVPLIAETGGQNAMIVDSTALPEQIVDDVITSAFRSAGQRCSALRVIFIQEGIADKVIHMLKGACKELTITDPIHLSTDIGPVIDKNARKPLEDHAARMDKEATFVAKVDLPPEAEHGSFFAPRAYEIESLSLLKEEVFGPVLHIIRYKASEIDSVIDQINDTGYGLTFGIHTRIDHVMRRVVSKVNAGNCYVNRSMIGAVVGVQPFGGNGLSGTGPKAGGPHYLLRFATEKTITIDTTASGGNTTLVSLTED